MAKGKLQTPENKRQLEVLEHLLTQAWSLTDEEIDSLKPGDTNKAVSLLDRPEYYNHCFTNLSRYELDNPDEHLLKVMRNPMYFPFTCRHLFGLESGRPLEVFPTQAVILQELWNRQFPMLIGSRGLSKSFSLALYILLRLTFQQGSKVVICATSFRAAKIVFEYMERIWYGSPVFRDLVGGARGARGRESGPRRDIDRCEFVVGDSVAMALPLGDGKKIRGLRAGYTICEEFASVNEDVYTTVIQGFSSVSADPVQSMKEYARIRLLKNLGMWTADMDQEEAKRVRGNQSILSGTAYYSFNHFAKYWRNYKEIILSGGDPEKLEEIFKGPTPDGFDWRAYSIIRIPADMMRRGYMDQSTLARAKQTTHTGIFNMEYGACFTTDSEGFFRRSLIEKCVVGKPDNPNPPTFPSCGVVHFSAQLKGKPDRKYIYGIDPASENDSFAVTIVEAWPEHRRVVYCWTTKKSDHRQKLKKSKDLAFSEHDFYRYCSRKIRNLFREFPPERLMVDAGGGGISLREAFGDPDKLEPGELPIYEVIDPEKEKDTDDMHGLHLLEMCHFRDNAWVSEANHGLKKDLEDTVILFPVVDSGEIAAEYGRRQLIKEEKKAAGLPVDENEGESGGLYDTLEDCATEIEIMKDEMTSIIVTQTSQGLERWDTPENKLPGMKKGPLRKDRYSSLLLANMGARTLARLIPEVPFHGSTGGFADRMAKAKSDKKGAMMRTAPNWYREHDKKITSYRVVTRAR